MRSHKYRDGVAQAILGELNFKEQAQSITTHINIVGRMIDAHLRRADDEGRDVAQIREARLNQVERMIERRRSR